MRKRLTIILAAALVAMVFTTKRGTPTQEPLDQHAQSSSLVESVPSGHWAYPAIRQLQDGQVATPILTPGSNGSQPVTRFEMAVLLARIIEKLDQAGASGGLPEEKLATLGRLYNEFRGDMASFGADLNAMNQRISELARTVEEGPAKMDGKIVKQVFDTGQKVDAIVSDVEGQSKKIGSLARQVAKQSEQIDKGQEKIRVFSEVLAKVLVKMAKLEKSVDATDGPGLSRSHLGELRNLLKDFAVTVEHRLNRLETGPTPVPAQSRMPVLERRPPPLLWAAPRGRPSEPPRVAYPMPEPAEMPDVPFEPEDFSDEHL